MSIEFAYAQARAQARHGDRLTTADWQIAESSRGLAQYLHSVRATALAPRVQHLSATSSPHAIESSLRRDWRAAVRNASLWAPRVWRPSVAWTVWLADLPAIAHLLGGGRVLPWMETDPSLSRFVAGDLDARRSAIEQSLRDAAPLADGDDLLGWWLERLQGLWPEAESECAALMELVNLARSYRDALRADATRPDAMEELHDVLEQRVVRLMRTRNQQPVTVFCHLALTALELRRLRSGLIHRALFNDVAREIRP